MADSFDFVSRRPEMEQHVYAELVPNWAEQREAALEARSPIRWPEKLRKGTPILLLHGSADWRVHPSRALRMAAALYEAKHPFRFVFFEGGDHGLSEASTGGGPASGKTGWITMSEMETPGRASSPTAGSGR